MKKLLNNIKLICGEVGLWFRLAGLWLKRNWKIVAATALLLVGIFICIFVLPHGDEQCYYIDWSGNQGTAIKCWSNEVGLFCEREYGGVISVQQYWPISP